MKNIVSIMLGVFAIHSGGAYALPIHQKIDWEKAQRQFKPAAAYDYSGTVRLSGCSGSLVRFESSKDTDKAVVLTNGHCVSSGSFGGMMDANTYISNKAANSTFQLLKADGGLISGGTLTATKILYATITWNDIALYEVKQTYSEIKNKYGIDALVLDSVRPAQGTEIDILSGYWQRGYSCKIDGFAYELHEAEYVSKDSMRYSEPGCDTIHGTSGSPVLSHSSRKIIGINSTGNDNGEKCTMDNPCEVAQDGTIFYRQGLSYADQTYVIYSCLDSKNKVDLKRAGCELYH